MKVIHAQAKMARVRGQDTLETYQVDSRQRFEGVWPRKGIAAAIRGLPQRKPFPKRSTNGVVSNDGQTTLKHVLHNEFFTGPTMRPASSPRHSTSRESSPSLKRLGRAGLGLVSSSPLKRNSQTVEMVRMTFSHQL